MNLRWTWMRGLLFVGGLMLIQCGCAQEPPKSGGTTSVNPSAAEKPGTPETALPEGGTVAPEEKEAPAESEAPATTPSDAGSTTGGGTETPAGN